MAPQQQADACWRDLRGKREGELILSQMPTNLKGFLQKMLFLAAYFIHGPFMESQINRGLTPVYAFCSLLHIYRRLGSSCGGDFFCAVFLNKEGKRQLLKA